jgi:hypothetical protein
MTNLLGPGAFGALRPAAARPPASPTNGVSDPDDWFQNCSTPIAGDGTVVDARMLNAWLAQFRQMARRNEVPESNLDDDVLARALRAQRANSIPAAQVGGTGNAITLTCAPSFAAVADVEWVPLRFVVEAVPTGAVTIAVDGLAAAALVSSNGTQLAAGSLAVGQVVEIMRVGASYVVMAGQLAPLAGGSTSRAPRLIGVRAGVGGFSVPTSTNTQITGLIINQNNLIGTSTFASSQLTIGAGEGGVWLIGGFSHFSAGSSLGFVSMSARINGTQRLITGEGTSTNTAYADFARELVLVPGDVVSWWCFHQAGGTIGTLGHEVTASLISAV